MNYAGVNFLFLFGIFDFWLGIRATWFGIRVVFGQKRGEVGFGVEELFPDKDSGQTQKRAGNEDAGLCFRTKLHRYFPPL